MGGGLAADAPVPTEKQSTWRLLYADMAWAGAACGTNGTTAGTAP
jgi:hypothetical protein